jgi:hypothetical protein
MHAENREWSRMRSITHTLPPVRAFDTDALVAIERRVDVVQFASEALNQLGGPLHVRFGAWDHETALVPVPIIGHAEVILSIDKNHVQFHGFTLLLRSLS